jgi:hypothetical protein
LEIIMFSKSHLTLAAFVTLAAAGTAARADDITMANEAFMSAKTRAEVRAETLKAIAAGTARVTELDLSPTMAARQGPALSREQVRAEVGATSRAAVMMWYPA